MLSKREYLFSGVLGGVGLKLFAMIDTFLPSRVAWAMQLMDATVGSLSVGVSESSDWLAESCLTAQKTESTHSKEHPSCNTCQSRRYKYSCRLLAAKMMVSSSSILSHESDL
jgi:hypothetical protein